MDTRKTTMAGGRLFALPGIVFAAGIVLWGADGGSLLGTVTDPGEAAVPSAKVSVISAATGVRQTVLTDSAGLYFFPNLQVGTYDLLIEVPGFAPLRHIGVVIDVNSKVVVDGSLTVGGAAATVTVSASTAHVDLADTQMGEVINGNTIASVPLNGRSYTDLLALQTGVAPGVSQGAGGTADVGVAAFSPSGNLNPGTLSINGQRQAANSFVLNGSDVEEAVNEGAAVIPNLDSIAEFRILTSNFDAEFGEFSGGQISVVTKSGGNSVHGDLFQFLRNTDLDARNFFSPTRGAFIQNQFGATVGGPIRKNKVFYFADYQGTRLVQGIDTGEIPVPSLRDRTGDLSDLASEFTTVGPNGNSVPTTVSGPYFADSLAQRLGYGVSVGEPYYFPGCTSRSLCVFPKGVIPRYAWSAPAAKLLQYIPLPNNPDGTFSTSAYNQTLRDDKGAIRLDGTTIWGMLSAYAFMDEWAQNNPYPVSQGGASVPGFNALNSGRAQLLELGDTTTFGSSAVNELHLSFTRDFTDLGQPVGGVGTTLASQGFVTGLGTPGIVPLSPGTEGVMNVQFNSFSIGTNTNTLRQANNTYQVRDSFSKVLGSHRIKVGAEMHYYQVNTNAIAQLNGSFSFFGTETGSDFADFLLGIASQYNQSQLQAFYPRNKYAGLYAEDSWRLAKNLTLNYGLRWDRLEPWYEKYNQLATFEPGKQSVVFPGAPEGILFPTDPGVPPTIGHPGNRNFAPRIGLAYSPKFLGGPDKISIRASYGIFYTAIEGVTVGVSSGNAPYGTTYTSPAPPLFAEPFITAATGQDQGQYFPVQLAPLNSTASHPDTTFNWSQVEPISGMPNFVTNNSTPYAEEYMLSIQRGFGNDTLFSVSYVGTQAHHLLVLEEANPGNPSLCLYLSNPANLAPGQTPCGPFGESNTYVTASGQTINGTRGPLGPAFGSDTNMVGIGNSTYNSLQVTLRHMSGPLQMLAAYTYSKSLDNSSDLGEQVNPLNPALSRAPSSFDLRQNFVVTYNYRLPFARLLHKPIRWTDGWTISGITRFSTGFPVTLVNYGDNSLLGAEPNGVNNFGIDEPDVTAGNLDLNHNPRNGQPYFNTALFTENALGTPGNAARRFFYGPGTANYDIALQKTLRITESKALLFRFEGFNIFNHAEFFGGQAVDGNIGSPTFGRVVNAAAPRLIQIAGKFLF